jgi:hypothetical protein
MAILRSLDGRFFEIPDDQVDRFLIPEDQVKAKLAGAGAPEAQAGPPSGGEGGPPSGSPTIVVQIYGAAPGAGPGAPPPTAGAPPTAAGEVQPYGWWNNWWHNRHGGWNNWWHNWHR